MNDYLKELCSSMKIQLIYTDDDYTALSTGTKAGKAFLKVDKVFMGCPEKVAKAVIGYYTEPEQANSHLKVIRNYIFDNIVTVEFVIEPPDRTFEDLFAKHIDSEEAAAEKTPEDKMPKTKTPRTKTTKGKVSKAGISQDNTSSYVELDISSITKKSFYSGTSRIKPDEAIKPSGDDVIELDIEIGDTKN